MSMFKSSFTQVAQDGISLFNEENHAYEEIDAYHAPSECNDLISKHFQKTWDNFFESHGWEREEWVYEAKRRGISERFIYHALHWMNYAS